MSTLAGWMDRYRKDVIPLKAPRTQRDNLKEMYNLERAFGEMSPEDVEPHHIYAYRDARGAPIRFNREKALLSHLFSMIIEWGGFPGPNPCREVRREMETPKDRYVEDWELAAFIAAAPPRLAVFAKLKYLTGLRKGDVLRLTEANITDAGLSLVVSKTTRRRVLGRVVRVDGKPVTYAWSPDLCLVIAEALGLHPTSEALIPNLAGGHYTESGLDSNWKKAMAKVVASHGVRHFGDHDIRAKTATDDPSGAQKRLQHKDAKTTSIYVRNRSKEVIEALPEGLSRVVKD